MTVLDALQVSPLLATALLGLTPASLSAHESTIAGLRMSCMEAERFLKDKETAYLFSAGYCAGFFAGMGEVLATNCNDSTYGGIIKMAPDVTVAQSVRTFLIWADAHPADWQKSNRWAMYALITGLPCQR